ncbi:MAG: hypothetical protein QOI98_1853 [Solirubrobacteraceae bacterium]|nr:hypothetical protein [Solirubrobacteraceae bacterium]
MPKRALSRLLAAAFFLALALPGTAAADLTDPLAQWLPSPDDASWTYDWTDSAYTSENTREQYTVAAHEGTAFRLFWTSDGQGNGEGAVSTQGLVDYNRTTAGLANLNWQSVAPPPQFPVLCASTSGCGNSVASTHFMLIWGTRSPVLAEPLLKQTRWSATGGVNNDVASDNRYLGSERITVPAFPDGVVAAKVQSDITQAGALGDPYGSGIRTVWWVYGVGPVRIEFRHTGGEVGLAYLSATSLTPRPPPLDTNYLPFVTGERMKFRWRNSKHMRSWSRQQLDVVQVVNNTARVDVKSLSGPIKLAGSYLFSTRLTGVTNVSAVTKSATRAKFPSLGPRSQPKDRRRHLLTPLDFMVFGFNPILAAYPGRGQAWESAKSSRDFSVFGVTGSAKVAGFRKLKTKLGTFNTLVVRSTLTQPGYPFGSGQRTSYFAPGKGLVKLVFKHKDGSVSTVERLS